MKRKLEELNLLDDFLFGTIMSHPLYGKRFARILVRTILNRDIKVLKIVSQQNYYGQDTDRHGARLDVYIEEKTEFCKERSMRVISMTLNRIKPATRLHRIPCQKECASTVPPLIRKACSRAWTTAG